jgi:hypothetical protein
MGGQYVLGTNGREKSAENIPFRRQTVMARVKTGKISRDNVGGCCPDAHPVGVLQSQRHAAHSIQCPRRILEDLYYLAYNGN